MALGLLLVTNRGRCIPFVIVITYIWQVKSETADIVRAKESHYLRVFYKGGNMFVSLFAIIVSSEKSSLYTYYLENYI
jgi:hypothetical protein